MLGVIKRLLLKIVDDIDSGNSNISEEDAVNIVDKLKLYTNKDIRYSKYAACEYLHISRATFDNYVKKGLIPKGKHELGFKELSWYQKDLDKFKNKK